MHLHLPFTVKKQCKIDYYRMKLQWRYHCKKINLKKLHLHWPFSIAVYGSRNNCYLITFACSVSPFACSVSISVFSGKTFVDVFIKSAKESSISVLQHRQTQKQKRTVEYSFRMVLSAETTSIAYEKKRSRTKSYSVLDNTLVILKALETPLTLWNGVS